VNTKAASGVADYTDLCGDAVAGKVSFRAKRPTLIAFAFANGMDPFASYRNPKEYAAMMEKVGAKLADCKKNVKFFWDGKDQLLSAIRSGEITAAMAWDTGGWKLNSENPDVKFVAPKSGALGWVDTFAIPAKGRNDDAAYKWINFNLRPEIAAKVAAGAGNFTASAGADKLMGGKLKDQFAESFPKAAIDNIKWYPAVPAGIEEIEGKVLDRLKAGS
jgi:spermidine/putrescine transport system substrate-binding protein